ncbi:hypothetical protein CHS0354_031532 [Potamilus streckersoni]|uniref:Dephospho-CoA kinase domain-containing protein n=1 Tax=Potamilus streckersoni TaxID=2493646 RepID=A0AAE0VVV7_9BIVA|nr:hypothetical protein CHS0354_031532 [Potamilus streckersoni]
MALIGVFISGNFRFGTRKSLSTVVMFLVGLTGGIASGKSTVSRMFNELGCPLVDADLVARKVVEPGQAAWKKIREKFGDVVFLGDGKLNREKLGEIVFANAEKRKLLNSITHPEIYKVIIRSLLWFMIKGSQFVILDLPLLFESAKMVPYMTFTIVVSCSEEQQLHRLMKRNNFSEEEARARMNSQMSLQEKCRRATYVIDNSNSVEDTRKQVKILYDKLQRSKAHWKLRFLLLSIVVTLIGFGVYFVGR